MKVLCLLALTSVSLFGQGAIRVDPQSLQTVSNQNQGAKILPVYALPYANVTVCNAPANGTPCTNYAQTYTDSTANTTCPLSTQVVLAGTASCQNQTDGAGSFGFWLAPGQYVYTLIYQGNPYGPYPITVVPNGGPYDAPFTGSVPRTYQSKFSDTISVKDFGADSTGLTDSTAALIKANMAASSVGGGTVSFPSGHYAFCDITLPLGVSWLGSSGGGQAATNPVSGDVYATELISNCASTSSPMIETVLHWSNNFEKFTLNANNKSSVIFNLVNNPRGGAFRDLLLMNTASGGAGMYFLDDAADSAPPAGNQGERIFAVNMAGKALIIKGGTFNTFINCIWSSASDDVVVFDGQSDDNLLIGGSIFPATGHTGVVWNYSGDSSGGFMNNLLNVGIPSASGSTIFQANNNAGFSYVSGYASCCGTLSPLSNGGLVRFTNSSISGATGIPNSFPITVLPSDFAYQNTFPYPVEVIASGGTITGFQVNRNSLGSANFPGPSIAVVLQPTDILVVAYTSSSSPNTLTMVGLPQP